MDLQVPSPISNNPPQSEIITETRSIMDKTDKIKDIDYLLDSIELVEQTNPVFYKEFSTNVHNIIVSSSNISYNQQGDNMVFTGTHHVYQNQQSQIKTILTYSFGSRYDSTRFTNFVELGKGNFGIIYQVYDSIDNITIVLKILNKKKNKYKNVLNEVSVLNHLKEHCEQYFLCYIDFMEDDDNYYILTEFLGEYKTLDDYIYDQRGMQPPESSYQIIKNLVMGLQELHRLGVGHHDIKPQNIMINPTNNKIKYIDFGLSCLEQSCQFTRYVGTFLYYPPEGILSKVTKFNLDVIKKWDIWSLGLTIFELLTGNVYYDLYCDYIYGPALINSNITREAVLAMFKMSALYNNIVGTIIVEKMKDPNPLDITQIFKIIQKLNSPSDPLSSFINKYPEVITLLQQMVQKNPDNRMMNLF